MLHLPLNEHWTAAEPELVARLILDGRLDRSTPARDLTREESEGPLERFVEQPHLEELSAQLLQRLQMMYQPGPNGLEPAALRARVHELCKWNWPDPVIRARLLWVAGWLAELTGSLEQAIQCYDAFLRQRSPEESLRLLAYNNRGVLHIRLGQPEGVADLARAAIMMDPERDAAQQLRPLPAACFNLLNLLNLAAVRSALRDDVEGALIDFMAALPKDVRERWLGPDPKPVKREADKDHPEAGQGTDRQDAGDETSRPGASSAPSAQAAEAPSDAPTPEEAVRDDLRQRLHILQDTDFRRLNRLVSKLAIEAVKIAPPKRNESLLTCAVDQLRLWHPRPQVDVAGEAAGRSGPQSVSERRHDEYAEVASLLYARHVPSSLTPREYTVIWAERLAQDSLGRSEEYLARGDYDLARSALESTQTALRGWEQEPRVHSLLEQVQNRLDLVRRRQSAHEQLELHEACAEIRQRVEEFCTLTSVCQAQRSLGGLTKQLGQVKTDLERVWGEESARLMDDLGQRATGHLERLERQELEAKVQRSLQRLREHWPDDWSEPVRDDAYRALAECRAQNPGRADEWDALKAQLNRHQAQYHFRRALRSVSDGNVDAPRVEEDLLLALSLDPSLGPAAAPLFGLLGLPSTVPASTGDLGKIPGDLLRIAGKLLERQPLGPDGTWSATVRSDLVREACELLQRLFRAFPNAAASAAKLWEALAQSLERLLTEGYPEIVAEIEQLVAACLAAGPEIAGGKGLRADPRNPLNILLEQCRRAGLVGRAERALHGGEPDPEGAGKYFTQALELGLDRRDHLQRVVRGLYLTQLAHEDPPDRQRAILDALDDWVAGLAENECRWIRPADVSDRVAQIRQRLDAEAEPPDEEPDAEDD